MGAQAYRSMPLRVPLLVFRSGGENGKSLAREDVSSVRGTARAFSPGAGWTADPVHRKNLPVAIGRSTLRWLRGFL